MVCFSMHPASLVDPAIHSSAIIQLISIDISLPVIEYIVDSVVEIVNSALSHGPKPFDSMAPPDHQKFTAFVSRVISCAEVTPSTILTSLVYMTRARPHLSIAVQEWALERVFLGALIVASKYTNDSTLRNAHWALCTGVFGKRDVGRIEREFLEVLNWDLGITESELLAHYDGLLRPALYLSTKPPTSMRTHSTSLAPSYTPTHTAIIESELTTERDMSISPQSPMCHTGLVASPPGSPYKPCHRRRSSGSIKHPAQICISMDIDSPLDSSSGILRSRSCSFPN